MQCLQNNAVLLILSVKTGCWFIMVSSKHSIGYVMIVLYCGTGPHCALQKSSSF